MANEQNLIPNSERSPSQLREQCRKGGIISQKKRKERKLMQQDAQHFLEMPLSEGQLDDIEYLSEVKGANITVQQAILLAMIKKAMKGDRGAAEYVRDTAGQQVTNNINVGVEDNGKFADIIAQLTKGSERDV